VETRWEARKREITAGRSRPPEKGTRERQQPIAPHQARTTTLQQKHGRSRASCESAHIDAIDHTCTLTSPRLPECAHFRRRRAARTRHRPLPVCREGEGSAGRNPRATRALDETAGAAAAQCTRARARACFHALRAPTIRADAAGGSKGAARALRGGAGRGGAQAGSVPHVDGLRVGLDAAPNLMKKGLTHPTTSEGLLLYRK
jgi:hypothetical protein